MFSSAHEVIVLAFTVVNAARVGAYLPQIIRLLRCDDGAASISLATWGLFLVSNITTVAYAIAILGETWMSLVFAANAVGCFAILTLTCMKRLKWRRRMRTN